MKHLTSLILLICFSLSINAQNQTPILDRKVTIKVLNQTLGKALNILSETAKFNFSYSTQIVKVNKIVSIHAENRTVKEILDQLFGNDMTYQQIGNHLVIQKKIVPRSTSSVSGNSKPATRYDVIVSGYIRDLNTGDGINNVSVYHKPSLANTLSGDFGYYKISLSSKTPEIELQIRREQFKDTLIKITYSGNGVIEQHINLQSVEIPKEVPLISSNDTAVLIIEDTATVVKIPVDTTFKKPRLVWIDSLKKIKVEDTKIGQWLIGAYQRVINSNIRDSFDRDWQITFVPPLGTNGSLSGLVQNKLSFNVLLGYNGGLYGAEFGGILNFVRNDMHGVQFAGIGNTVGRSTEGAQFAGIFNHNLGQVRAFQAAGFYNYNHLDAEGAQFSGFMNINRGMLDGFQAAGFGNFASRYSRAVQVAGFINVADEIDGGQIAGFINIARKIRGFQIGIINIADSSEGVAIGIVNFIKNGIHQLEFSYSDLSQYGVAYRSGSGRFYSVVSFNSQLPYSDTGTLMCYGFAIGHRARLSKHFYWTTDLGSHHMTYNLRSDHLNLHNKLSTGLEIQLFKGFSIFGTASLNHCINDSTDPRYETGFAQLGSDILWNNHGRYEQKAWLGYNVGVRIF
ncbi:MAG: STN and carboxypeptidase regulatory-like domain-containing protein [Chitinophagaceae bacterium]